METKKEGSLMDYPNINKKMEEHHAYTTPIRIEEKRFRYREDDWIKKVVIIGAGGFGREAGEIAKRMELSSRNVKFLGYLDDNKDMIDLELNGDKVLGDLNWIDVQKDKRIYFACGIGDPKVKKVVIERALEKGYKPINIIDPKVEIFTGVELGEGIVIQKGTCLAVNCKIKNYAHINFNCSIGHDVIVGEYSTISPLCAISGYTELEEGVFIGSNTTTFTGVRIGKWSQVGAGSVVAKELAEYTVNIGSPTRIIKRLN